MTEILPEIKPFVVVTGDIVFDCHLYVESPNDTGTPGAGTVYKERLGGAALTCDLLSATADSPGLFWDDEFTIWKTNNRQRLKKREQPVPLPKMFYTSRTKPAYDVWMGIDTSPILAAKPTSLCSYGVWTPDPVNKGNRDLVWRVAQPFGYGPGAENESTRIFKRASLPENSPLITIIDDGARGFRHINAKPLWPTFSADSDDFIILKTCWPLCCGDLWNAIQPVMKRLIVIINANDLRRHDAQIDSRLSWEQCAEQTINELENNPALRDLQKAALIIICYHSAGAMLVDQTGTDRQYHLLYDPLQLEGDHERVTDGKAYGYQTCMTVGIAHHIMCQYLKPDNDKNHLYTNNKALHTALVDGIIAGMMTKRKLHDLGHGKVGSAEPGFPLKTLAVSLAEKQIGLIPIQIMTEQWQARFCQWSIISQYECYDPHSKSLPLSGLAELTARFGIPALEEIPALHLGRLFSVDRSEIESLRTLESLIREYEEKKVQSKPLSIGVFGPPGAGKSFGVKSLAASIFTNKAPFLEFNLSQFHDPKELIGAFHQVRDAVLQGITPVVFWDEFDAQNYYWLQYLLAPMQDGTFRDGEIIHPIGKSVFIFAGGTSPKIEDFGVLPPADYINLSDDEKREYQNNPENQQKITPYQTYRMLKGPDFISRLHGYLNVLGPNDNSRPGCIDITWPIRRAILIRGMLGLRESEELDVDAGLLRALLCIPKYEHGARSLEKIVKAISNNGSLGKINRSALLPNSLLARETNADGFISLLVEGDRFKNIAAIEDLAAIIHHNFLAEAEKSLLEAEMKQLPEVGWKIHPLIKQKYQSLSPDFKASNIAAARRIPDHLALIGFVVTPLLQTDEDNWQVPLTTALEKHIERLAIAEHRGWCLERKNQGWCYGNTFDNDQKHHPLLVPWQQLSQADKEKDRSSIRAIVKILTEAKYKALPGRDLIQG